MTRKEAMDLLKEFNREEFHIRHGVTVGEVMGYLAEKHGYGEETEKWYLSGLLHDLDFEMFPDEHCVKTQEILNSKGVDKDIVRACASHGYGLVEGYIPEPIHEMEKILFASDELTGLIWAYALMRPSKSTQDMEVSSLKKKFKDKKFAAGCDRKIIKSGAERLGWDLERLMAETLEAMQKTEKNVDEIMADQK